MWRRAHFFPPGNAGDVGPAVRPAATRASAIGQSIPQRLRNPTIRRATSARYPARKNAPRIARGALRLWGGYRRIRPVIRRRVACTVSCKGLSLALGPCGPATLAPYPLACLAGCEGCWWLSAMAWEHVPYRTLLRMPQPQRSRSSARKRLLVTRRKACLCLCNTQPCKGSFARLRRSACAPEYTARCKNRGPEPGSIQP